MADFSKQIKKSINGDEYYTQENSVDMIVPYIKRKGFKTIWCPFDKKESNFVKVFSERGYTVNYGHIDTGQDFFDYDSPQGEVLVSNPPFSKRDTVLKKLYEWDMPFAIILNFNGLFDNRNRFNMFSKHGIEMLVLRGRMKFLHRDVKTLNSPNFQSIYVCNHLLDKQIVFDETAF